MDISILGMGVLALIALGIVADVVGEAIKAWRSVEIARAENQPEPRGMYESTFTTTEYEPTDIQA